MLRMIRVPLAFHKRSTYYMDIYTLFVKNVTSREKERVIIMIIIITIMHNIKDTITHYKQGRGPRRNGNRKLK